MEIGRILEIGSGAVTQAAQLHTTGCRVTRRGGVRKPGQQTETLNQFQGVLLFP